MNPSRFQVQRAFTLVEIVLAIGIVAFAFVAIMGMLPVGLATFNNAVDATVEAQIAQQVFADAQQVKFADLDKTGGGRFFNAEGTQVGSGATPPANWIYHAVVNPPVSKFSGSGYTKTVRVDIAKNRLVTDDLKKERGAVRTYVFVVADVGL